MNVLLIEDDLTIAEFITNGLKQAGYKTDFASDGIQGLDYALSDMYDLAIIDIMLPKLDGLELINRIRSNKLDLPIIILSAKRSIEDRVSGLHTGADDYICKPFSFNELLARVQALLRRANKETESTCLSIADLSIDLLARTATRAGKRINLQPKEFSLLEYLVRNQGRVVSKTMIMERVWNYHFDPHTNIIEARMSKLREKIDKSFSYPLIHTIRGLGYVLKHDE